MKKQFFFIVTFILISFTSCEEYETCKSCNGVGSFSHKADCSNCKGRGQVDCTHYETRTNAWLHGGRNGDKLYCIDGWIDGTSRCSVCNGKGVVDCYKCNGYGYTTNKNTCNTCDGSGKVYTKYGKLVN